METNTSTEQLDDTNLDVLPLIKEIAAKSGKHQKLTVGELHSLIHQRYVKIRENVNNLSPELRETLFNLFKV